MRAALSSPLFNSPFKVLLTGADGLVGRALQAFKPQWVELHAFNRAALDITQPSDVEAIVAKVSPHLIINAAAYTNVDLAEIEVEGAYAVNRDGASSIAHVAAKYGAALIHLSTDYVFDGAQQQPYTEEDTVAPLNTYGASKLTGEQTIMQAHKQAIILRTSTVFNARYEASGGDFVAKILNKAMRGEALYVVDSLISRPTAVQNLAEVLWCFAEQTMRGETSLKGIVHYADQPEVSRYEWAKEIIEIGREVGLVKQEVKVIACSPNEHSTPAKRPEYSVLQTSKIECSCKTHPKDWRQTLKEGVMQGAIIRDEEGIS